MALMTMKWTPDPETAEKFATYRQAIETERELKPDVRERAQAALRAGATGTQLARLTGMTPEVFRRMARDLELPVDPRYAERAEASRKQRTPKAAEQQLSPLATHQAKLIAALTDDQAAQLATRAYSAADRRQYADLNEASTDGDKAVITAALANGTIDETALRLA